MPTAVETIARALAEAHADALQWTDEGKERYVSRRWCDHELDAKRVLRQLKDQPPHVLDAGAGCVSPTGSLNAILEAMARG